ncbi:hypothetical protein [Acetobacter sicerae]|uniref:hypothetical protein n=1 Tax=Acetobacter sicerae TaxID=85325 RepID=UPI00156B8CA8|nr:hypothetical protein [Acetobacter sicerae]NHN92087.1 hypothetical protein [Acetobacter sicerae]
MTFRHALQCCVPTREKASTRDDFRFPLAFDKHEREKARPEIVHPSGRFGSIRTTETLLR